MDQISEIEKIIRENWFFLTVIGILSVELGASLINLYKDHLSKEAYEANLMREKATQETENKEPVTENHKSLLEYTRKINENYGFRN